MLLSSAEEETGVAIVEPERMKLKPVMVGSSVRRRSVEVSIRNDRSQKQKKYEKLNILGSLLRLLLYDARTLAFDFE